MGSSSILKKREGTNVNIEKKKKGTNFLENNLIQIPGYYIIFSFRKRERKKRGKERGNVCVWGGKEKQVLEKRHHAEISGCSHYFSYEKRKRRNKIFAREANKDSQDVIIFPSKRERKGRRKK